MQKGDHLFSDFELSQHINSFTVASDRVRHCMLTIVVASILVFAGFQNSRPDGWLHNRIEVAKVALENECWLDAKKRSNQGPIDAELIRQAENWVKGNRFRTETDVRRRLAQLEEAHVESVILMRMPVLGIAFDVNDLGMFSGIGFSILMLMLWFSISRHHQNLYLCLWRVRRICDQEDGKDNHLGRANLLYHSLAMAQLFTKPPTLARWKYGFTKALPKALVFLPIILQSLILFNDLRTLDKGSLLNKSAALTSISIQIGSLVFIVLCTAMCLLYSRAADKRWRKTFYAINPQHSASDQPTWRKWMLLDTTPLPAHTLSGAKTLQEEGIGTVPVKSLST